MMRRLRYQVAMSLDGYIAGPNGEFDWIVHDPDIDFGALYKQFDTLLVGRKTFELMAAQGETGMPDMTVVVCSTTMRQEDHPSATIVSQNLGEAVRTLKAKPGKDIWLFGGGQLFRSLLAEGVVDTVEVAVVPVLVGGGLQMLPSPAPGWSLELTGHRLYPKSGIVLLEYRIASRRT